MKPSSARLFLSLLCWFWWCTVSSVVQNILWSVLFYLLWSMFMQGNMMRQDEEWKQIGLRWTLTTEFFFSNPIYSLIISIAMLGWTHCWYVNGGGRGRTMNYCCCCCCCCCCCSKKYGGVCCCELCLKHNLFYFPSSVFHKVWSICNDIMEQWNSKLKTDTHQTRAGNRRSKIIDLSFPFFVCDCLEQNYIVLAIYLIKHGKLLIMICLHLAHILLL